MARGDRARGWRGRAPIFPNNHLRLFTTKKIIYLRSPSRLGASRARGVSRVAAAGTRRARVWPSPVSTPLTTECHVPLRRLTLSECSDPRPGSQYSELRRQTTSHTHDRRVRTYTSQQSRQRRAPLPRFGGMWPHHPFATQCAADPTVRSSSSASMVTLQSFSKCIGFAPRRPKLRTGQNEAAERIRQ